MVKKLINTDDDGKYFSVKIVDMRNTPSDNLFVETDETKSIIVNTCGTFIATRHSKNPKMNFLVPKRRNVLIGQIKNLDRSQEYIFKLLQERFSGKWCVSEVFVR